MVGIIPELAYIEKIKSLSDIFYIRDFIFSTVPWLNVPYEGNLCQKNLSFIYRKIKNKEIGGWCGFHATLFDIIMKLYKVECRGFNYGLRESPFTHVVNIVTFEDNEYLIDPYLSMYYAWDDGSLIKFSDLLNLIYKKELHRIHEIYSHQVKPVQQEDGSFIYRTSQEFLKDVIDGWTQNYDYVQIMKYVFNSTDPKMLMMIKIGE